jgi:hypothetical protein
VLPGIAEVSDYWVNNCKREEALIHFPAPHLQASGLLSKIEPLFQDFGIVAKISFCLPIWQAFPFCRLSANPSISGHQTCA